MSTERGQVSGQASGQAWELAQQAVTVRSSATGGSPVLGTFFRGPRPRSGRGASGKKCPTPDWRCGAEQSGAVLGARGALRHAQVRRGAGDGVAGTWGSASVCGSSPEGQAQ